MRNKLLFLLTGIVIGAAVMFSLMSSNESEVQADCQDNPCVNPPCCNGDVNGDGTIDISDAVYLLNYLFSGGDCPLSITRLPVTGQTNCYDQYGAIIDCNSPEFPGQDGYYQIGYPNKNRFIYNGDGTVSDTCTGLMWQQVTSDINNDGDISEENDTVKWPEALQYCESLEFAGYDDWRLPNVIELRRIVHHGLNQPSIEPIFQAESDDYWTSTTQQVFTDGAWTVAFYHGATYSSKKYGSYSSRYVRAVRTILPGE